MYRIIGSDGKTYGPVGAESLRQWIAQGRADSRTLVYVDGASDWTYVGLLPEFARDLAATPPPLPKIPAATRPTNGFATAGFVCGLISCVCCCGCPFNLLGLIFSLIALVQIGGQVEKQNGWGLALAGLICSLVSLLLGVGLGLLQLALSPAQMTWHFGAI